MLLRSSLYIISDCKLQADTCEMGKKEIEMKLEWDGTSEPEPGQDGNESLNPRYNRWLYGIKVSSVYKNWGEKDEQEDFFYLLSV